MKLENVYIVLARPEESRNIGSACRAMANCGITNLRIVGKRENFDEERVRILAIHAADIWERAEFFESIKDATADCVMSAATTRRRGKKRKGKLYLPEEFCDYAKNTGDAKIAVVFGNERTGLEDDEVDSCTMGVTIPTSENFPSLNLSHAVQIICHYLYRAQNPDKNGFTPIDLERLDKTVQTVCESLKQIGFFKLAGRADMENFWRGILSRAVLSESEAKYIEKVFTKAAGLSASKTNS